MGVKGSSCSAATAVAVALVVLLNVAVVCNGGKTSIFVRKAEKSVDMPIDSDVFVAPSDYNATQQVHITQGDRVGKAVIVSWVTLNEPGKSIVHYWSEDYPHKKVAKGKVVTYRFHNDTSVRHNIFMRLEFGLGRRPFWFLTPPEVGPDMPYTFGLIGDLGQTFDSNITLSHYELNPKRGQAVLFVGDLSYADDYPNHDNVRWDTLGRFIERSAPDQPWIWTSGNHELDFAPEIGETIPYKPYTHRYHVPYKASGSTASLWYSIKRASAHIIVLASYSAYGKYTPQYEWLKAELPKERISNVAYNIVNGLCGPVKDQSAPVYITIGDGGNIEGIANNMIRPQPEYSAYQEASFGHAIFEIKNRTHTYFSWQRNEDGDAVQADSVWFLNRHCHWHCLDDSTPK